jgi:sugar transferase (PEP-CTERM/EpsH1 system associated)
MRILVVLSRVPWPLEKGDKLRAYHLMREWSEHHKIYLFCLSDKAVHPIAESKLNEICERVVIHRLPKLQLLLRLFIGLFNKLPFQVNYFYSKKAKRSFDKFLDQVIPDHIFCQLARTAEYTLDYSVITKSLDYMDAFSTGMLRMSEKATWPLSAVMRVEYNRLKNYEEQIQSSFRSRFIISNQDRTQLNYVENLEVVPNGIDPIFLQKNKEIDKKFDILFTGNMSYRPNVESAKWLVNEIMPMVWRENPNAIVCLCGANPSNQVKSLASKKVHVTGWVDDISIVYQTSKVFIAPMIVNTGLQNKLLEAMACHIPSITTTLANNALGATDKKEILIADSSVELAKCISQLLEDKSLSSKLGKNGHDYVTQNFSWIRSAETFEERFKI